MYFKDRTEAGQLLTRELKKYRNMDVVVYALPRGGLVTAYEIAKYLHAPLDLIIARKIGHRYQPEYAVAATAENGDIVVGDKAEVEALGREWFRGEIKRQQEEAARRREKYLKGYPQIPVEGKIAILVDDGVATGLTMRVGIMELRHRNPKKIIVAVPVIPEKTAEILKSEADEVVALEIAPEYEFLGAVGAYYDYFPQIEDEEVISIMELSRKEHAISRLISMPAIVPSDPVVFSFPDYKYMADDFDLLPNFTTGKFKLERFANSELHLKLESDASERPCIILGTVAPPDTNLFSLLLLAHTIKKEEAFKIIAIIPYLSYARHDKKEPRKSYAAALVGNLFQAAGIDEVLTVDIHSPHAGRLFPIPLRSLSPAKTFAEEIKKIGYSDATIVAPDEGAIRRCEDVSKELGSRRKVAYMVKKRIKRGIVHSKLFGKVGEKAVIVDDILDTGGTLVSACERLVEAGVQEIIIMITHGLFTGNAWKRLWKLNVKNIYCTDTIPRGKKVPASKIKTLSVIPLISEELRKKFEGTYTTRAGRGFEFYDEP